MKTPASKERDLLDKLKKINEELSEIREENVSLGRIRAKAENYRSKCIELNKTRKLWTI